ncbi:MAG: hypothetical protein ACE368_02580 [Paracoccaceae bacterium]
MTTRRRWIDATIAEAARTEVKLPWQRGARRAAWIAKRDAKATDKTDRRSA